MQDLGWRQRWGSCPAARRRAAARGLDAASARFPCLLEMLHSKQLSSIKMLIDSNHGIYRELVRSIRIRVSEMVAAIHRAMQRSVSSSQLALLTAQ